jgi:hypothetical protein
VPGPVPRGSQRRRLGRNAGRKRGSRVIRPSGKAGRKDISGVAGLKYPGLKYPGLKYPGLKYPGLKYPGLKYPGLKYPGLKN